MKKFFKIGHYLTELSQKQAPMRGCFYDLGPVCMLSFVDNVVMNGIL